ncbi:MAG: nucleotidyltransferase family protein, partial [Lachnospiraceae bacterium]|nr:nucleotidyltransferase family protein [Lachnospiraceae bacterium]
MNIVGIIAEYNPFHQGHALHLREARALTNADYVVVIMSGNYVQRGTPAMFDKYACSEAALR